MSNLEPTGYMQASLSEARLNAVIEWHNKQTEKKNNQKRKK